MISPCPSTADRWYFTIPSAPVRGFPGIFYYPPRAAPPPTGGILLSPWHPSAASLGYLRRPSPVFGASPVPSPRTAPPQARDAATTTGSGSSIPANFPTGCPIFSRRPQDLAVTMKKSHRIGECVSGVARLPCRSARHTPQRERGRRAFTPLRRPSRTFKEPVLPRRGPLRLRFLRCST